MSKMYGDPNFSPKPGETEVEFWKRINSSDTNDIGLYCQSCCYRYPELCMDVETLHPYDRAAESCPDFIPKDYYKAKSRAKCWLKKLEVDPSWSPLPNCTLPHPIYWWTITSSENYYKIMTKLKSMNYVEFLKKLQEG